MADTGTQDRAALLALCDDVARARDADPFSAVLLTAVSASAAPTLAAAVRALIAERDAARDLVRRLAAALREHGDVRWLGESTTAARLLAEAEPDVDVGGGA